MHHHQRFAFTRRPVRTDGVKARELDRAPEVALHAVGARRDHHRAANRPVGLHRHVDGELFSFGPALVQQQGSGRKATSIRLGQEALASQAVAGMKVLKHGGPPRHPPLSRTTRKHERTGRGGRTSDARKSGSTYPPRGLRTLPPRCRDAPDRRLFNGSGARFLAVGDARSRPAC